MTKITYDVQEVEEFTGYTGPTPKRGVYEAVVSSSEFRPSAGGLMMWEIILRIDSKKSAQKEYNGCPLWQYVVIGDLTEEYQKRNLKGALKAFGKKEKGSLDPEAFAKQMEGKRVRVIVKNEMYVAPGAPESEGELKAKADGLLPFKADETPEAGAAEEPEAEEPEAEEPEAEEEEEAEEPEEEEAEEEEESTVEDDIKDLDRAGLKQYIKDNAEYLGDRVKVYKSMSDDDIRAKILEEWPSGEEEPEGDGSEPPF